MACTELAKKLLIIQGALKAPKSQYNKFGKYSYRSNEDILEKLKPVLKENGCILVQRDEIVCIGNRVYVKAVSTLTDVDSGEMLDAVAYAREDEGVKGMHQSQVTGSTSSYARKYSLNGLLLIDDNKDPDSTNTHGGKKQNPVYTKPNENKSDMSKIQMVFDKFNGTYGGDLSKTGDAWKEFKSNLTKKYPGGKLSLIIDQNYDKIIKDMENNNTNNIDDDPFLSEISDSFN